MGFSKQASKPETAVGLARAAFVAFVTVETVSSTSVAIPWTFSPKPTAILRKAGRFFSATSLNRCAATGLSGSETRTKTGAVGQVIPATTRASHLALHSGAIFGVLTVPVHEVPFISDEQLPVHVPAHAAGALSTHVPVQFAVQLARTDPSHIPSHTPRHALRLGLPSHLPEQVPLQIPFTRASHVPMQSPAHLVGVLLSQEPEQRASHVPSSVPGSQLGLALAAATVGSHWLAQTLAASSEALQSGGAKSVSIRTSEPSLARASLMAEMSVWHTSIVFVPCGFRPRSARYALHAVLMSVSTVSASLVRMSAASRPGLSFAAMGG